MKMYLICSNYKKKNRESIFEIKGAKNIVLLNDETFLICSRETESQCVHI